MVRDDRQLMVRRARLAMVGRDGLESFLAQRHSSVRRREFEELWRQEPFLSDPGFRSPRCRPSEVPDKTRFLFLV
jgi:hypothetical protein